MDPDKRATAEECLQHPWLNMSASDRVSPPRPRLPLPKKEKMNKIKNEDNIADSKYESDYGDDGENLDDELDENYDEEHDDEEDGDDYDEENENEMKTRK